MLPDVPAARGLPGAAQNADWDSALLVSEFPALEFEKRAVVGVPSAALLRGGCEESQACVVPGELAAPVSVVPAARYGFRLNAVVGSAVDNSAAALCQWGRAVAAGFVDCGFRSTAVVGSAVGNCVPVPSRSGTAVARAAGVHCLSCSRTDWLSCEIHEIPVLQGGA